MNTPLAFAAKFLARRGALVEVDPDRLEALLPQALAAELGLQEHAVLGERHGAATQPVGYGSTLLDRMVASATRMVPFVSARALVAVARAGQARAAAEALPFRNGVFSVGDVFGMVGHRLVVHGLFTLHGDERREGLCTAAVSLMNHGIVPGFEAATAGHLQEVAVEVPDAPSLLAAARAATTACAVAGSESASAFREAARRRSARDQERLEGYFQALLAELDSRVARGRVGAADADDRRSALQRDRSAKLEALSARYATKLDVAVVAAVLVEAPVNRIGLELRRRKATRNIEVEFDCATRRLVLPPCDACGGLVAKPAACDDAMHLLCDACAPRSEGRISCPACHGQRRRGASARAA